MVVNDRSSAVYEFIHVFFFICKFIKLRAIKSCLPRISYLLSLFSTDLVGEACYVLR